MTYMITSQHQNPTPVGHEIQSFSRPFLGHHYYILNLSDPSPSVDEEKKYCIFTIWPCPNTRTPAMGHKNVQFWYILPWSKRRRNNANSLYDKPQHKNPCSVGYEIYNFYRSFLGYYYNILSLCLNHAPEQRRRHQFYPFYPRITLPLP